MASNDRNQSEEVEEEYVDILEPEDRMEHVDTGPVAQDEDNRILYEPAPGSDVTQEMLLNDLDNPESWLQYGGSVKQLGYSPADALTPQNVDSLSEQYTITTDRDGLETTPTVVPGDPPVMYFSQGNQVINAVNARTGDYFWEYRYNRRREIHGQGDFNRGVSFWQDKVYFGSDDVHVLALDRYTGELQWITDYLAPEVLDLPHGKKRAGNTEAPLTYGGKLFIGQTGDNNGWTTIQGLDAESGDILWQYRTGPKDAWVGESWKYSSGGAWMTPGLDPKSGKVFFATGNPNPALDGTVRPGPNKNTDSIIAVDIETGEIDWVNQILAHELWDYDVHTVPYVFDMETGDGETTRVVGHDNKNGWSYFLDVEDGALVRRTEGWSKQEHRFGAWPGSDFLNMPPAGRENKAPMTPVAAGATEWPLDAYSPDTGLRYINVNGAEQNIWYEPDWRGWKNNFTAVGAGGPVFYDYDAKLAVTAVDPESREVKWETKFPESKGKTWGGGTIATGGGLVFSGSNTGKLMAVNAENGERLWTKDTGGRITATPSTWYDPVDGKQYVAVASNDQVIVYAGGGEDGSSNAG